MLDPMSLEGMFAQYGRSLLWAITAAVGFGLGVGISLKVFDWLSSDIDEWEEIKKGKMIWWMRMISRKSSRVLQAMSPTSM